MIGVLIRAAQDQDKLQLARLREALWPDSSSEEHVCEITRILRGELSSTPVIIFVAESLDGRVLGFLEVGISSHADGCDPAHPVGFIEGWYVLDGYRRLGIGKKLVRAAEEWARSQGCAEIEIS
jgi:aminoglycoside 6'-N-acetyltransferase I